MPLPLSLSLTRSIRAEAIEAAARALFCDPTKGLHTRDPQLRSDFNFDIRYLTRANVHRVLFSEFGVCTTVHRCANSTTTLSREALKIGSFLAPRVPLVRCTVCKRWQQKQ